MEKSYESGYKPIRSSSEAASVEDTEDDTLLASRSEHSRRWSPRQCLVLTIFNVISLVLSFLCVIVTIRIRHQPDVLNGDLRRASSWCKYCLSKWSKDCESVAESLQLRSTT